MKPILFKSLFFFVNCMAALKIIYGNAHGTEATLSMQSLSFMGRWDLRTPDRAVTVNTGSCVRAQFSGSTIKATFDVLLNKPDLPTIAWRIDDQAWHESEIAATVPLASQLSAGPHTVWLMVRGIDEHENRWTEPLVGSVTFLGFGLPEGGIIMPPRDAWEHPRLKIEFLGDSITEGVLVAASPPGKDTWAWQTDALDSHVCQTAMLLGASWRQVGFGATGLAHGGMDPNAYEPLYVKYLALVRKAYPQAKIAAVRPFAGGEADSIKKAVEASHSGGDNLVYFIDTTGWYSGDLHPNAASSLSIAAKLAAALKSEVLGSDAQHPSN
jgi:hypothetical protein